MQGLCCRNVLPRHCYAPYPIGFSQIPAKYFGLSICQNFLIFSPLSGQQCLTDAVRMLTI